ncbi:agip51 [Agrotis ipsilon multiple nucleopolyhedrovirus]|uniref:Uncharacterized protein n=1 Tax=Agrotis ipsilon multiple nucleopolyhedrovirus TaxID=208013 RepID=B6D5W5_9ABAC|nr:agip51 [Agrotis ipsilon multiple nucleopolyhedrovirus]ACI28753.1 unknown [Agrotis ipsilon multiple nucleopolyhedrovirus]
MDNDNYPAVASFDKYINDIRFSQLSYDQHKQRYVISVDIFDIDERYIFDSDNDRLMNLLVPQQFQVRLNRSYYTPESVEYQPEGHLNLRVLSPTADIESVAVHVNMRYFDNGRIPWTVPDNIKAAYSD